MKNTFQDRLGWLLGGRKPHPWGEGVGWSRGVIQKLGEGVIPGSEYLGALARAEGVNLNWLLTGEGRPFQISPCPSDAEAAELVSAHLADSADWLTYLLRSGDRTAIALEMPASFRLKDVDYPYTVLELITGVIGPKTMLALKEHRLNKPPAVMDMTTAEMDGLEAGELGTWAFTREGGILRRYSSAALQGEMTYAADGNPTYVTFTIAGKRERKLIERLRELSDEEIKAVETLIEKLPGNGKRS